MAGHQACGIPLVCRALYVGLIVSLCHITIMAHVIQHRLPESPFAQRSCHTVYVGRHLFSGTGVARFVIYFYGYDTVIPGIRLTGIRIDMPRQMLQIIGLSLTCPAVFMYPHFGKRYEKAPVSVSFSG